MSLGRIFQPQIDPATQGADDKLASRTMTMDDYRMIHRESSETFNKAQVRRLKEVLSSAYAVAKVVKPPPSRNILFLTFFSSATMLSMLTTHYLLSDSVNTIRRTQAEDRETSSIGPDHVRLFNDPATALAKDRSQGKQVEDPYLSSWKASEKAPHGMEGGVAGLEDLVDKYATSHGDH
ncbi:hypothetical protein QFC22_005225 [Naganishia vaughanmartiniae]|uniref:Uncharacterized protein n=1 Tax=Naganishia vaughanmartiniae TaxID=1424756 RepID=A0ACC2WWQ8_9TREE|nr:hypothetical protein QFC22_005225 [Naganishia vaughanmartiniae]